VATSDVELSLCPGYCLRLMLPQHVSEAPLLIFDLDGTLYRTESSFVRTMLSVYRSHGITYPGDAAILGMVGETFDDVLTWLSGQGFACGRAALQDEIARIELGAIREHGALFDGVRETLEELGRRGCTLALCTNGDRRYVDAVLARGEIGGDFAALSTLEPGGSGKSERVGELVRRFSRRRSMLVGDRYHDLEAARANGCRMVGATYGYAHQGELDSADVLISTFSELLAVVERWDCERPS